MVDHTQTASADKELRCPIPGLCHLRPRKCVSIAGLYQPISQLALAPRWPGPAHWPQEQTGPRPNQAASSHEHRHQAGKY